MSGSQPNDRPEASHLKGAETSEQTSFLVVRLEGASQIPVGSDCVILAVFESFG